jgi:hypothetical protein
LPEGSAFFLAIPKSRSLASLGMTKGVGPFFRSL